MEKKKIRLKIPISLKLIVITVSLLLVVTSFIAVESAKRFEKSSADRVETVNREVTSLRATDVEGLFVNYLDKVKVVAALLDKKEVNSQERQKALELTFRRDRDLVSVEVWHLGVDKYIDRVVNADFLKQYQLSSSYIDVVRKFQQQQNKFQKEAVFAGEIEIRNASLADGAPLISIGVPFAKDDYGNITKIAIAEVRLDRLQKIFGKIGVRKLFLVDREGYLLSHPDEQKVFQGASMSYIPVVKSALTSDFKLGQERYEDVKTGEVFTGAFAKTSLGVTVIAEASKEVILEDARAVQREAFYIAGQVISAALFFVFIFSMMLTAPIEKLVGVTMEIAKGNFSVSTGVKSRDEVGELATAVDHMIVGLKERDKVKNVLNKFHGSSVAEDLIKGDLELGGSSKKVTVFFSDIRDFTKYSEAHSAAEVVEMLNEYFQVMVSIINKHNGVVDKFVGDAIMAVWGAPEPTPRDSHDAIKACLEMRIGLAELNEKRIARGEVPLKIGMGVHTGHVISGNIGSDERMEYTVIGDTVNQAARIEASTKAFGADLLLSNETVDAIGDEFIVERAGAAEVKGKTNALELYKVRGFRDINGHEIIIRTEYSDYESGDADKVKVA